jgi:WD40 repeat protein
VWDVNTQKPKFSIRVSAAIRAVCCSSDGRFVALGDFGGNIRIVSLSGEKITDHYKIKSPINAIAVPADFSSILIGDLGGNLTLLNLASGIAKTLALTNEVILGIAISKKARIAVATQSGNIYLCDYDLAGHCRSVPLGKALPYEAARSEAVAFSPDGNQLMAAGGSHLLLLDPDTGKIIYNCATGYNDINAISFSADGSLVAAVDTAGKLWAFDARTARLISSVAAHRGTSFSVDMSPDGRLVTVGRDDLFIKLWDPKNLELQSQFSYVGTGY